MEEGLTPEQQAVEQEALQREAQSQANPEEAQGVPEGFNEDGTPIDESLIDGKFKSQEDLLEAYKELERKLHEGKPEKPTKESEAEPEETSSNEDEIPGGLTPEDFTKYVEEFVENEKLSEDTYKALEAKGLSKDIVDSYIEGQQALDQARVSSVHQIVGGAEQYQALMSWASQSLSESQIDSFNRDITSTNIDTVKYAIENLMLRYQQSEAPRRINGASKPTGSSLKPFSHFGEYSQATGDKRYGKDASYTNMVDNRYLISKF